ncbi:mediator of RNA polymerase II transcription subunit 17 [Monosporozyma unispora]|nr:RNA polymerase II mediator complex subunit [Kazachstania unispora]
MDPTSGEWDVDQGINLALDPNLITLPLDGKIHSHENITSTESESVENEVKKEDEEEEGTKSTISSQPTRSLINNPYEIYGQMPLTHLIPLILQQRKIPFSQLSEETILNSMNENVEENNVDIEEDMNSIDPLNLPLGVVNEDVEMEDVSNESNNNNNNNNNGTILSEPVVKNETDELPANTLRLSHFNKIRSEMVEQTNIALNEASLALETVSLLLSATRENNAKASISPFLKRSVPLKSLNSDSVPRDPRDINDDLLFSVGWKLKCLDDSKTKLKDALDRLKFDLTKEHTYWRKIGKYISNNDVLFKMRDKSTGLRTLAVKYGFEDSGSNYRHDRGVAILRNNMERNMLELVPLTSGNKNKNNNNGSGNENKFIETFLRVRIYIKIESEDDFILSGESSPISLNEVKNNINNDNSNNNDDEEDVFAHEDIRGQIQKLKDIIFEKELLHQLKKECSLLISYGVKIENENKIIIELPNEKFEIELLYRDDINLSNHEQDAPKINDKRANLFLIMLRMLLTIHFKKNLKNRYTIIESRRNGGEILLVRPILSKLRHQNYKSLLKKIIKDNVLDFIPDAKLKETALLNRHHDSELSSILVDRHISRLDKEIAVFDKLINPPSSEFTITSESGGILKIILSLPNYCTAKINIQYENLKFANDKDDNQRINFNSEFSEFKEVEEFLHFIVSEFMTSKS